MSNFFVENNLSNFSQHERILVPKGHYDENEWLGKKNLSSFSWCRKKFGAKKRLLGREWMVTKKNLSSFSWRRKKLGTKRRSLGREEWLQKKPNKLFLVLRKAWRVCFLQSQVHMEKSQNNKKRQRRRKSGRMVIGKTLWNVSRHRKKLHEIVFCNEGVQVKSFVEKTCRASLSAKRSLILK